MGQHILTSRSARERGYSLVEIMVAMVITITVMLATLAIFNASQRNFAAARAITNATNLGTTLIDDFKTRVISARPCFEIGSKTPADDLINASFSGNGSACAGGDINPDYPGIVNEPFCSPASSFNTAYDGSSPLCIAPGVRNPAFALSETLAHPCCASGCGTDQIIVAGGSVITPAGSVIAEDGASITLPGGSVVLPQQSTTTVDGVTFTTNWIVSYVDVDNDATKTCDMTTDVLKIKIWVTWNQNKKINRVTFTTFTNGKATS